MEANYERFVRTYSEKHSSAVFYPHFLKLKKKGHSPQEIRKELEKVPESTIYFWYNEKRVPFPYKQFSSVKTEFKRDDLKELAIIIGHLFGDGGIGKDMILHYCNTEEILVNEFQSAVSKIFGCNPIYTQKKKMG